MSLYQLRKQGRIYEHHLKTQQRAKRGLKAALSPDSDNETDFKSPAVLPETLEMVPIQKILDGKIALGDPIVPRLLE